jgi:hypothetical protein
MPLLAKNADELGMAEGPLLSLMKLPAADRSALVPSILATGNATRLSSGHRMVSEQVAPLMAPLQQLYAARAMGATVEMTSAGAEMLSANMPNNYSPTTFLVQAMGDTSKRAADYVATVAFVNGGGYEKAQRLAHVSLPIGFGRETDCGVERGVRADGGEALRVERQHALQPLQEIHDDEADEAHQQHSQQVALPVALAILGDAGEPIDAALERPEQRRQKGAAAFVYRRHEGPERPGEQYQDGDVQGDLQCALRGH